MVLSIAKAMSLVFLAGGNFIPALAAEANLSPTPAQEASGTPRPSTKQMTPEDARKKWIEAQQKKPDFGLLQNFKPFAPKEKESQYVLGIENLRRFGEAQLKTNPAFKDFVRSTKDVAPNYVLTGFLLDGLPQFPLVEGKDAASSIRTKMTTAMDDLLIVREKKGKPLKFRPLNKTERTLNLAATFEIAQSHFNKDKTGTYGFEYWKNHFDGKQGQLKDNATVQATINTRATAAALAVVALQQHAEAQQLKGLVGAIYKASKIEVNMFRNFVREIDTATGNKLAAILSLFAQKTETPAPAPVQEVVIVLPKNESSTSTSSTPITVTASTPSAETESAQVTPNDQVLSPPQQPENIPAPSLTTSSENNNQLKVVETLSAITSSQSSSENKTVVEGAVPPAQVDKNDASSPVNSATNPSPQTETPVAPSASSSQSSTTLQATDSTVSSTPASLAASDTPVVTPPELKQQLIPVEAGTPPEPAQVTPNDQPQNTPQQVEGGPDSSLTAPLADSSKPHVTTPESSPAAQVTLAPALESGLPNSTPPSVTSMVSTTSGSVDDSVPPPYSPPLTATTTSSLQDNASATPTGGGSGLNASNNIAKDNGSSPGASDLLPDMNVAPSTTSPSLSPAEIRGRCTGTGSGKGSNPRKSSPEKISAMKKEDVQHTPTKKGAPPSSATGSSEDQPQVRQRTGSTASSSWSFGGFVRKLQGKEENS